MTPLDHLRKICLALPDTHEKRSHGAPSFFNSGGQFVMFANNHHGDGRVAAWVAQPPGAQEALLESNPKHFFRPPYVGPRGWVGINLNTGLAWGAVAAIIAEGHSFVAARKKQRRTK